MKTLLQQVHDVVSRHPDHVAVHHLGRDWSYGEIWRHASTVASWLRSEGLRPGQRVAVLLPNSMEYVAAYLGILIARGIVVALNPDTTVRELSTIFANCQPGFIVCGPKSFPLLNRLKPEEYGCSRALSVGASVDAATAGMEKTAWFEELPAATDETRSVPGSDLHDVAQIIYTSGTSGAPKGVTLSHRNLAANGDSIVQYLKLTSRDAIFVILPFFYSYGNSLLITHLAAGGRLVLASDFVFWNRALELMERQRATGFAGVPSSYAMLLHKSDFSKRVFRDLRYLTCAGGALSPAAIQQLRAAVPHAELFVMYGQTEATARLSTLMPAELDDRPGSIGRGIPGVTLSVRNLDGDCVAPGEVGEIVAQGENVMVGYWNDPEATASVIRADGLHTGDLAKVDDDGYIYVVGRASEMIKSGAYRISPKEIEEVLAEVPGVQEAAVVGLPDEILGEVPIAYVVLSDEGKQPTREEMLAYAAAQLPKYKLIRDVVFVNSLPKTASGKIRRAQIRAAANGQSPAESADSLHGNA